MTGTTVSLDSGLVASLASLQVALGSGLVVSGNATLDLAGPDGSSLATLGVFGGTLAGAGTRTVTGSATIDTGTLTGTGRTVIGPGASLVIGSGQGGTLAIGGGHVLAVDTGATATWGPGPHDITLDAPSRIEVAGTLDIINDRTLGGSGTLAVTGTLRKLSHGTTAIGVPLDPDGTLAVEAGLLDAAAGDGGLGSDGSIAVGQGARLRLSGARTIGPAGSVTGAGILEVTTSGTVSVPATATWGVTTTYLSGNGSLTLDGERTLERLWVFGGTLAGSGTRTVTRDATLDSGTLSGNGRTAVAGGGRLVIGSGQGGTLTISGGHVLAVDAGATATWGPGPHDIQLDAPSRIEVAGDLEVTNDRTLGGSGTLAVSGSLRKLSHATTVLRVPLDIDGTLAVEGGLLEAAAGDGGLGTDGTLSVAARSRLRLSGGSTTIGAAASVTGPGEVEVTTNATLSVPATATWGVTTTYLTGNGALNLDGDRSLERLGIFGGTLTGSGTRTVTGDATLDSGTLSGNGRTVIGGGAVLTVGSGAGGTLTINGGHVLAVDTGATAAWGPGPHDIQLDAPSRIEVAGQLDISNDRTLGGSGTLALTGTLRKLSHGTTTLRVLLDADGSVDVAGGVLDARLGDGGLVTDGTMSVAARSRLRLAEGSTTLGAAASVTGPGEVEVTGGGSLSVPASATWDVGATYLTGGTLTLDGERSLATLGVFGGTLAGAGTRTVTGSATIDTGTLTGTGRTVIGPGASLVIGSGQGGTLAIGGGHVLAVDTGATATWGPGPHDITLDAPSRIEVAGTLDIINDRTLGGSGTLAVTGTLRKLSHGTTVIGVSPSDGSALRIEGTIEVRAGLVDITGPGLDAPGTIAIGATSSEVGTLRATAFRQPAEGHLRIGLAGVAPFAHAGRLTVTAAPPELSGSLEIVADPAFAAAAPQSLSIVVSPAAPVGEPTVTGADQLPGGAVGQVEVTAGGVVLEVGPSGG